MLRRNEQMAVLGEGRAHGGCSLLHAAAFGYGASIGLNLPIAVRVLDKAKKKQPQDDSGLLNHVITAWLEANHPLPVDERSDLHWSVASKIPIGQGLKSSSALCVAAIRALAQSVNVETSNEEVVHLATRAHLLSDITLTGSIDDAWACSTPGWKLIDTQAEITEGVLIDNNELNPDDWTILIILRGERTHRPNLEDFQVAHQPFEQALQALQNGNPWVALTWNGRGIAAVTRDVEGRKMANDAFVNGARASGISGSGNAIVVVVPSGNEFLVQRLRDWYSQRYSNTEILECQIIQSKEE